jgi:hypothetical protein
MEGGRIISGVKEERHNGEGMGKGEDAGRERTRDDIPHLYKQRPASIQMTSGSDTQK